MLLLLLLFAKVFIQDLKNEYFRSSLGAQFALKVKLFSLFHEYFLDPILGHRKMKNELDH